MPRIPRERNVKGERIERNRERERGRQRREEGRKKRGEERRGKAKCGEKADREKERGTGRRKILGVGKTGERTEDIELKWPLGAHSSIPLSLP